jgi:exopolysaccharide biosynthesis predicted pyruvyltransferase EpsI
VNKSANPVKLIQEEFNGNIVLVRHKGNFGDRMIELGMEKSLREAGISFTYLREINNSETCVNRLSEDQVSEALSKAENFEALYLHGGGNFNDLYGFSVDSLRAISQASDKPVIIGPQTVFFEKNDPEKAFEGIQNDIHFFCREKISYEKIRTVESLKDNLKVYLSDDTAFHLEKEDLVDSELEKDYHLIAFRDGLESAEPPEPEITDNTVLKDISIKSSNFQEFIDYAANASRITTDRLHVAILGSILQKKTVLYDNSYYKNRAVYRNSLSSDSDVEFERIRD